MRTNQTQQTLYMSEKEVATATSMSLAWVRKARMLGNGPKVVRIGRACRYPISDFEAWRQSLPAVAGRSSEAR